METCHGQMSFETVDGFSHHRSSTHTNSRYSLFQRKPSLSLSRTGNFHSKSERSNRYSSLIIRASAPPEELVAGTEPLTKRDLVEFLSSGCKPKHKWRIGTEHEKFGFDLKTLKPMSYEQIAELLEGISERFNWKRLTEDGLIIGLKQDGQSVSLEPGGQFELSGAPLETLHQTCAEVNSHLYQVKAVAEEMGLGFLGIGFHPKLPIEAIPIMPKGRYEIMRKYMPKVGTHGHDMMFRTCTVQVGKKGHLDSQNASLQINQKHARADFSFPSRVAFLAVAFVFASFLH
ncbi:hypothetical protein L7F22_002945 [Adiantum nelumboides]|nr:hypothetical protein [Adiantum nelumboides]